MTGTAEKVYSEAVFELAKEQGSTDEIKDELAALAVVFNDNPELGKLLSAPTVNMTEKLELVEKLFKGKVSDTSYNLLCVVTEKGRARLVPSIAEDYKNRWYEMKNIAEVKVTSSVPLSDGLRTKLKAKLEKVWGKSVILTETVDPEIMGGIVVNYGNTMMDGSVKTKLEAIQKQIKGVIA
ncbi:MAG: ATP synthase F1 subunit delta [Ruminococcus sp.]|nr:ATP synthase F1 subunit delta [Ruminococcus sp.]MCM1381258.1 ATP synthase F1 subunit delta [Muribaculaceae bacterium]MCM1478643.1 ATP synthase F1 subunit delta [Muribaculaceae bacterium]